MSEELIKRLQNVALDLQGCGQYLNANRILSVACALESRPAPAVQVPPGFALVPVELTDAMRPHLRCLATMPASVWECLLDAAPTPAPATVAVPTPEQVADELGIGSGAWDMVEPEKLIAAVLKVARIAPATVASVCPPCRGTGRITTVRGEDVGECPACRAPAPVATEAVAQGGEVDVEKVMGLVEEYGDNCFVEGRDEVTSNRVFARGEQRRIADAIRALLASAPAVPVGDGNE